MDLDVPKSILGSEVHVLRSCTLKFSYLMTRITILTLQTMNFRREESRTLFFFGGEDNFHLKMMETITFKEVVIGQSSPQ